MKCFFCGKELPDNAQICTACGSPMGRIDPTKPQQPAAPVYTPPTPAPAPIVPPAPAPQPRPQVQPPVQPPVQPQPQVVVAPAPQQKLLGPWAYFGLQLLFSIPLVGFILLIVFSLDDNNLNRRNFARSYWCSLIVGFALFALILVLIFAFGGTDLLEEIVRSI